MKNLYDEEYYERGIETGKSCYTNYRWIPELTIPMAARLIEYLNIKQEDKILDFGCAKGFLVKALRLLHRNAFGYDFSDYAITAAPEDVKPYVSTSITTGIAEGEKYDLILSKDVFEHISYEDIDSVLKELRCMTKRLFVVVPLGEQGKYVIPAYELDKTHIIREDLAWWKSRFINAGFICNKAEYRVEYIKDNWSQWERGNGFFTLTTTEEVLENDALNILDEIKRLGNDNNLYRLNSEAIAMMIDLYLNGIFIDNYLSDHRLSGFSIYGFGDVGKVLYSFLKNGEVFPQYIVDRKEGLHIKDNIVYKPNDDVKDVDLLIITALNSVEEIKDSMKYKFHNMVSLMDILNELKFKYLIETGGYGI